MWTDIHMVHPSELQGASRTTEGHFCGRAHGNVFNLGDAKEVLESGSPMIGKVKVFRVGQDPAATKPHMTMKMKIEANLAPVLDQLAKRYSPIKSK